MSSWNAETQGTRPEGRARAALGTGRARSKLGELSTLLAAILSLASSACTCNGSTPSETIKKLTQSKPAEKAPNKAASSCVDKLYVLQDRICARYPDGSYRCRGRNHQFQSTHGKWPQLPPQPEHVAAFPGPWDQLELAVNRTYGIRNGKAWAWGENWRGTISPSAPGDVKEPLPMEGRPDGIVQAHDTGELFCTLHQNRDVWCRTDGGDPYKIDNVPNDPEEIAGGGRAICVRNAHEVRCHGGARYLVEGGDVSSSETIFDWNPDRFVPIEGLPPDRLTALAFPCVLTEKGEVWCWGGFLNGGRGNGVEKDCSEGCPGENLRRATRAKLPPVQQLQRWAALAGGEVWLWGSAGGSIRALGVDKASPTPFKVEAVGNDNALLAAGGRQDCVRKIDGRLVCWGVNSYFAISDQRCRKEDEDCGPTEVSFDCSQ